MLSISENFVEYFRVYTLIENKANESGYDVDPSTILDDPNDKIPVNISTFPEELKKFNAATKKRSDAANKQALDTSNNNSKNT